MDVQYYDLDSKYINLQFPKTFEECCNVLNISTELPNFHRFDLHLLYQLITCVKAYHKICNYTPNLKDNTTKFIIANYCGNIVTNTSNRTNYLLNFPSPLVRNIFETNFKDLIKKVIDYI